ncbi:UDP-glycosyltransferase 82A1 [Argentina anserina]|uniref:UDP-glycosyltransferase 82A1 n=1 Tax=Argentina anserina TaxID=57926 RepID=UPI0021766912|nr:UDP-glycosyltransferase 82A1 [Potentilla anserina]
MKCIKRRSNTIILVPYPAQGHVTPMLMLASAFLTHGFNPVLVTPDYIHRQIVPKLESKDKIQCIPIPDGLDKDAPRDFFTIEKAMENTMPVHLEKLVHQLDEDGGVVCIVIDLLASWAIDVANRCGIPAAGFWPAMLATYRLIGAIPEMVRTGFISDAGFPKQSGGTCFLPNQPMLSSEELPWLIGTPPARTARFRFWTRTLERSESLQWLLVNSFPNEYGLDDKQSQHQHIDLHQLVKTTLKIRPQAFPIGPLSKLIGTKNPSFWEEDTSCLGWLDKQQDNTVIYISFGSWVSPIGETKVKSLALALEALGKPFIWVLGPSWREGLPIGYLERVARTGKIVSWSPQMDVLKHKAVGCYLTHCGWNSTMEAIQCHKRLLCYPVAGDQFVNCGYIVNLWRIGVRLGGFGVKDVEEGLKRVMEEDEMGNRLRKLCERTMGDEANNRAVSNLKTFTGQLKMTTVGDL